MAYEQIPLDPEAGSNRRSELVVGRVTNVVLSPYLDDKKTRNPEYKSPSDIGKILYNVLYRNKQVSLGQYSSRPAWPMFSFVKQYPVIGELVMIVLGPSSNMNENRSSMQAYYFPPFSVWNSPNHNAFPEMFEYAEFLRRYYEKPGYEYDPKAGLPELPKGAYFSEKPIKNLVPFEGDSIIEGRFGQSIRFGSTSTLKKKENNWSNSGTDGSPITIIRNGQGKDTRIVEIDPQNPLESTFPDQPTVENLNYDHSSIYLTSGQEIVIEDLIRERNVFPMDSYGANSVSMESVTQIQRNPISNESRSAKQNDQNALR